MQPNPPKVRVKTAQSKFSWSKLLVRLVFWCVFLLLSLVIGAAVLAIKALDKQQIYINWQDAQLTSNALSFEQLTIQYQQQSLQLEQVSLSWLYQNYPLQKLTVGKASGVVSQELFAGESSQTSTQNPLELVKYLPKQLVLEQLNIYAPAWGRVVGGLQISSQENLLHPYQLQANLTATELTGDLLASIPPEFHPDSVQLTINKRQTDAVNLLEAASFDIDLQAQGAASFALQATVDLTTVPWTASFQDAVLSAQLSRWQQADLQAELIDLQTKFSALVTTQQLQVNLQKGTQLQLSALKVAEDIVLRNLLLELEVSQLQVSGLNKPALVMELDAPLTLNVKQAQVAGVAKQSLGFKGRIFGELPTINLMGKLTNNQGLQGKYSEQKVTARVDLDEVFFKSGNPFQALIPDMWPEILILNSGRFKLNSQLNWQPDQGLALTFNGNASGLHGELNRSLLEGLTFKLQGSLKGDQLSLIFPELQIQQLNPGVPVEPLTITKLAVQVPLSKPEATGLSWQRIQAGLLNGQVLAKQGSLALNKVSQLPVELQGVEIQELLRIYPAEGLQGVGIVDGNLPFRFDLAKQQFSVDNGQLATRAPGYLKFDNEKIKALGQSNQAMRIVTDALEDFHYDVLSGQVHYDESGKLVMNLRLEGRNPDLEKGRPIHFNINLEEDIPALLASLQLSGKVSETIQQRIKERLEKRSGR